MVKKKVSNSTKNKNTENSNPLISVVMPLFNAEKFVAESIWSICEQTYQNWELIIIDDKSTDNSLEIANRLARKDARIRIIQNTKNSGAGVSRNKGVDVSKGDFICFIDADDFWRCDKLMTQLNFMQQEKCAFSFTGYEFTDAGGIPNGKKVSVPSRITYRQALKNTTISTITVMFNMNKLTKEQIRMPDIRKGQDTATWWRILKDIDAAYGLDETLAYYRRGIGVSLSSNKIKALKRTWGLYRKVEHLGILYSFYNFCFYSINAIRRRV